EVLRRIPEFHLAAGEDPVIHGGGSFGIDRLRRRGGRERRTGPLMTERFTLSGSHAVVTGASKGIGHQLARELASRGAHVTVVARSEAPLKALADEIDGTAVVADLSERDEVDGLMP